MTLVLAALWVLPVVLMVSTSLKTQQQLYTPTQIVPDPIAWGNYLAVFIERFPFGRYLANSMFVTVATVVGDVLSSAFIAYGFAKLRFPGRRFLFILMISTMMFPFAVRMIPLFLMFKQFGWINTYYPLIVPSYFGVHAFFVFLLHQFFKGIPDQLIEAARIDGASELRIWWSIVLPLSRPALAVVGAARRSSRAGTSSCRRCSISPTQGSTLCRSASITWSVPTTWRRTGTSSWQGR